MRNRVAAVAVAGVIAAGAVAGPSHADHARSSSQSGSRYSPSWVEANYSPQGRWGTNRRSVSIGITSPSGLVNRSKFVRVYIAKASSPTWNRGSLRVRLRRWEENHWVRDVPVRHFDVRRGAWDFRFAKGGRWITPQLGFHVR
jgi:hypothetical protein